MFVLRVGAGSEEAPAGSGHGDEEIEYMGAVCANGEGRGSPGWRPLGLSDWLAWGGRVSQDSTMGVCRWVSVPSQAPGTLAGPGLGGGGTDELY